MVEESGFSLASGAEIATALLGETLSLEGGPIFAVVQLVATFVELPWGQDQPFRPPVPESVTVRR